MATDRMVKQESVEAEHVQSARPRRHWLLGDLPTFAADPLGAMVETARSGRLPRVQFLNYVAYIATHPDDIKHVLVDNHRNYHKGYGLQALKPVLGEGLLTSEAPFHTQQRRIIQPAFHRQRISAYGAIMTEYTDTFIAQWTHGQHINLHEDMMHLTMLIVAKCLFDADISTNAETLGSAISVLAESFNINRIGPVGQFIDKFDIARNRRRDHNRAVLDALLFRLIRERRVEGRDHGDLLSMILATSDEEAAQGTSVAMSDQVARDELITLFIAGHETTAIALGWTFYALSQNPEIEAKLLLELNEVLGDRAHGEVRLPTVSDMERLPYTRMVFAEAMRLYPPAYATARIAQADDEIAGVHIKKGQSVMVSQYVTHRDPRWWPDPERFDPERFTPEAEATRPKFAYFPFGGGPRRCVGEQFAWMEGVLVLATIAHRYQLRADEGFIPVLNPKVSLRPRDGIPMTLFARGR